ncbi:MAG: toll/interleukin-1 receptor domain-containing protein [Anaerolineales bacterium]
MPPTYDVFLSYNSRDREAVREVYEALKHRRLMPWLDVEALTPGRLWQEEAEEGLSTCRAAAVFVGPAGIGPWENLEMRALLRRAAQGGPSAHPRSSTRCSDNARPPCLPGRVHLGRPAGRHHRGRCRPAGAGHP